MRPYKTSLMLSLALLLVAAQAQATVWVPTQTHAVPLKSSIATQPVDGNMPVRAILSLQLQNIEELKTYLHNQHTSGNPQYGTVLSTQQFMARYAPSEAQVQAVTDYLSKSGFTGIKVEANRVLVSAGATAAQAQKTFNTQLAQFQMDGETVYAPVRDMMVPATLGGTVLSVLGLQNAFKMHSDLKTQNSHAAGPHSASPAAAPSGNPKAGTPVITPAFTAANLRKAYNAGNTRDGSNTVIAIATAGSDLSGVIRDLRQAGKIAGLPYVPVDGVFAE